MQIDDLDAGHGAQNILGGFDHAVQCRDGGAARSASAPARAAAAAAGRACLRRNSVNGVISNGFAPRVFSTVGSVVSVNCTWHDGHHDSTCPLLLCDSLSMRALAEAAGGRDVADAHLHDAAAMGRAAHDLIGDAERIHDVERQQRDVRRLEHVAAGVEHEVGFLAGHAACLGALPQPGQQRVVELHLRQMRRPRRATLRKASTPSRRCATVSLACAMSMRAM